MDVIQDHTGLREARTLPKNASKNDTSLCRGHLDGGFDALEAMGSDGINGRPLNEFKVSQGGEVEAEILQGIGCLIHKKDV